MGSRYHGVMDDEAVRRLFALLTGVGPKFVPRDHVLGVQDGPAIGVLLGAKDWVNFLGEEDFVRLAYLAAFPPAGVEF